ncbi:sensor histidine kinase [Streptomyces sp. NPDC050560]|uniref:sensor histidine kinase n=1 Tax=Streptomyces sp. NPDC050560 TaxID=3365630 RepID=UPI00378B909C
MVSVQSPPGGREVPYVRALLLPAAAMAALTVAVAATAGGSAAPAVALCGGCGVLLLAAVGVLVLRRARALRAQRDHYTRRLAHLEQRVAAFDGDITRLGEELLPQAIALLRRGERPENAARKAAESAPGASLAQQALLHRVLRHIDESEMMRDASAHAFVNIARRVQAIVHKQAAELRDMEDDHGFNPDVFDDLLRIDHGTALIGRLADSITVLGGARPGRQWPRPVLLYSVLRGAMSRILEYRRIELHSIVKVPVKGTAVEPLIHACAELLDNATRYSPPQTKVHVTAVEVQTGIAIEIEDGGVSLSEEARARAERMLDKARIGFDLNDLGETPRLGMAVVGKLAQMYNLQIALRQSAYGGVRAVLIVPPEMLTTGPAPGLAHGIGASAVPRLGDDGELIPAPVRTKKRRPAAKLVLPPPMSSEDDVPVVTEWTEHGLPQRRSRLRKTIVPASGADTAVTGRADVGPPIDWKPNRGRDDEAEPEARPAPRPTRAAPAPPAPVTAETAPGLWVEAFMSGVSGAEPEPATRPESTPGAQPAPDRTDPEASQDIVDEGNHK